jgi:hypothetical protein
MVGGKVVTNCNCCAAPAECPAGSFCDTADCSGTHHTLFFTFSGISLACGCVDMSSVFGPDRSRTVTANTSLALMATTSCSYGIWSGGFASPPTITFSSWLASAGCGGAPDVTGDTTSPTVFAWCDGHTLRVAFTDNIMVLFYGAVCELGVASANSCSCGQLFGNDTIPPGQGFGPSVGIGFGGTVIVTV